VCVKRAASAQRFVIGIRSPANLFPFPVDGLEFNFTVISSVFLIRCSTNSAAMADMGRGTGGELCVDQANNASLQAQRRRLLDAVALPEMIWGEKLGCLQDQFRICGNVPRKATVIRRVSDRFGTRHESC
jgi:hypothetical protein